MRRGAWFKLILGFYLCAWHSAMGVIITEIHYDPDVKTEWVEFIEIYNEGESTLDLSGWQLTDAVEYSFPSGSSLGSHKYAVVAQDLDSIQKKWPFTSYFPLFGPYVGRLSSEGECVVLRDDQGQVADEVDYQLGFPWPTVGDPVDSEGSGYSIQLVNLEADNNLAGSWRSSDPSPQFANEAVALENTPPHIRQVKHRPEQPVSGESVVITAKVTDDDGVAEVRLWIQQVKPGSYYPGNEAVYEALWNESMPMHDDGLDGDEVANDAIYSVRLDGSLQTHRLLMRYRIGVADTQGNELTVPYDDDPKPNFAYFVYDGVPAWQGAVRPGVTDEVTYDETVMNSLPVVHLISRDEDVEDCTWNDHYSGSEYKWWGTLVVDGKVYDHIRYRARGGGWRYAMGKNMWKFDFNRGHYLQACDDVGKKYDTTWDKLNLSACIQQGNYLHRGEQGMFEAASFRLFNMMGAAAPKTHWLQLRIIDEARESGETQYEGDFWGLYLAIEQMDGRFLDEHDLADGNLYKMESGTGDLNNQGLTAVTDKSDLNAFMSGMAYGDVQWWQDNVNMNCYYGYRCVVEGVHHGDIGYGKNYFYYLDPESQQWSQLPWDLDLSWAENMYGNGQEPFVSYGALDFDTTEIAYKNRMREFLDLLYNPDQMGQLLDELAAVIWDPNGGPCMVDADRAMWDYHPIMTSSKVDSSKAGQGRFYESSDSGDFAGMVDLMKDYVEYCISQQRNWYGRSGDSMAAIAVDDAIPDTPVIAYAGRSDFAVNDLIFTTSGFSDPQGSHTFKALKWRLARVESFSDPNVATASSSDSTLSLIEAEELWRYFKGTCAPQNSETLWRILDFDDGDWLSGAGPIGYGEDFVTTVLDDMRYRYSTVYLRKTFEVELDIDYEGLTLDVMYDDGIAIFLNGILIETLNVEGDALAYNALANGNMEQSTMTSLDLTNLIPLLNDGTNLLAVHLLNMSLTESSDCFFDARLTLQLPEEERNDSTAIECPIVTGRRGYYEIDTLWDSNDLTEFTDPIQVPATVVEPNATYRVRCRMQDNTGRGSHWSKPVQFTVTEAIASALQDQLRITEIMFNPRNPQAGSTYNNDDFEFLELTNISSQGLDVSSLAFTDGIDFDFNNSAVTSLPEGESLLLIKNRGAFIERYGTDYDDIIAGEYDGQLSNGGETLELVDTWQGIVMQFDYNDNWYAGTDGGGYSLELVDPQQGVETLGLSTSWQTSTALDGSPGQY